MGTAVGPDAMVTLSYALFDEAGELVDEATTVKPLQYVHGYAQILPGLEKGLEGRHAGESCEIVCDPEVAFGEHDDAGVFEVDKEDFPNPEEVVPGDEFVAHGPGGEPIAMRVVEVLADAFLVDTNHPLAGQRVRFEVKIADVRHAGEGEIAQAQAELEQRIAMTSDACGCGHDHGDHDHDHDHDVEAEGLVKLTTKKSASS